MNIPAGNAITAEMLARHRELSNAKYEEMEAALKDLKPRINELLYTALPPKTTLEDMENLALKMWELIAKAWEGRTS
jgi:hypothetical protein